MKRALSPLTNGVGYTALAGLLAAVAQAAWNAHNSGQPVTWQVIATAAVGVLAGWARGKVTPVSDPRDGNGRPLLDVATVAAAQNPDATLEAFSAAAGLDLADWKLALQHSVAERLAVAGAQPGLPDTERRRAENLRLMYAPGSPSFYPYPGEAEPAAWPPAQTATTAPVLPAAPPAATEPAQIKDQP